MPKLGVGLGEFGGWGGHRRAPRQEIQGQSLDLDQAVPGPSPVPSLTILGFCA